jgi:hypothetical protein
MATSRESKDKTTTDRDDGPEHHAKDVGTEGTGEGVNVPEEVVIEDPLKGEGAAIADRMPDLADTHGEDHAEIRVPPNARASGRIVAAADADEDGAPYDDPVIRSRRHLRQAQEQAKEADKNKG